MRVSPAIQKSMLNDGSTLDIAQQAAQEGSNSLRRAGLDKVMAGLTSLSEVLSETEATEDRRG